MLSTLTAAVDMQTTRVEPHTHTHTHVPKYSWGTGVPSPSTLTLTLHSGYAGCPHGETLREGTFLHYFL